MRSTESTTLRTSAFMVTALSVVLLTGCSGTGEEPRAAGPTSRPPAVSSASTPTPVDTSQPCPASGDGVPDGARNASTIDVDGDLEADQQWVTEDGRFGVTTTTGLTSSVRPSNLSGGAEPAALVADVSGQGNGPVIMLVAGSHDVDLYRWTGYAFETVTNTNGDQYQFDLTGRHGTGVGCTSINGARHLVGLLADRPAGAPLDIDQIEVTPIELNGTRGKNGQTTMAEPADDTAATKATQVTCDDRTLDDDGLGVVPRPSSAN